MSPPVNTTRPKAPLHGWRGLPLPGLPGAMVWRSESAPLQAISAVEEVEIEHTDLVDRHFHVSAVAWDEQARAFRACTDQELDVVRNAFQMDGADEDNHGEGNARHLWLRVGARVEDPCPCKQDEPTTVDGPRLWRP